jgi:hypothetical protein
MIGFVAVFAAVAVGAPWVAYLLLRDYARDEYDCEIELKD